MRFRTDIFWNLICAYPFSKSGPERNSPIPPGAAAVHGIGASATTPRPTLLLHVQQTATRHLKELNTTSDHELSMHKKVVSDGRRLSDRPRSNHRRMGHGVGFGGWLLPLVKFDAWNVKRELISAAPNSTVS